MCSIEVDKTRTWTFEEIDTKIAEVTACISMVADEVIRKTRIKERDHRPLPVKIVALMKKRSQTVKEKHKSRGKSKEWVNQDMFGQIKSLCGSRTTHSKPLVVDGKNYVRDEDKASHLLFHYEKVLSEQIPANENLEEILRVTKKIRNDIVVEQEG